MKATKLATSSITPINGGNMRKVVALAVLLSAPLITGCAIAMWGATMAVGAKIDQKQKEQKTAPAPQAPANAERSEK